MAEPWIGILQWKLEPWHMSCGAGASEKSELLSKKPTKSGVQGRKTILALLILPPSSVLPTVASCWLIQELAVVRPAVNRGRSRGVCSKQA